MLHLFVFQMRAHVNSKWFLFRKHVDNVLHFFLPKTIIPLYTMVSVLPSNHHFCEMPTSSSWFYFCSVGHFYQDPIPSGCGALALAKQSKHSIFYALCYCSERQSYFLAVSLQHLCVLIQYSLTFLKYQRPSKKKVVTHTSTNFTLEKPFSRSTLLKVEKAFQTSFRESSSMQSLAHSDSFGSQDHREARGFIT